MIKFGRPDLIAGVGPDETRLTHPMMNGLARMHAEGVVIRPGERIGVKEAAAFT